MLLCVVENILKCVLKNQVSVDGDDATFICKQMIENTRHRKQLKAMLLDGIALGGFNVVDIEEVYIVQLIFLL